MSKKLIIFMGAIFGVMVLLILAIYLMTSLKPRYVSFDDVEEKIAAATEKYFKKHPELLPQTDGSHTLAYDNLVQDKVIEPLSKVVKGGEKCGAVITIVKSGANYSYMPYVNCGSDYTTVELYKKVLQDNKLVGEGNGLYMTKDNEYFFRGNVKNNYVSFGSVTVKKKTTPLIWRILSIKDGNIKLISTTKLDERVKWDDRWNETENGFDGYNEFERSKISEYLTNLYTSNSVLNANESGKLVPMKLCVGARNKNDQSKTGATECAKLSNDNYYFGTITPYEYMRISLDSNCNGLKNRSCSNYNFLSSLNHSTEWTVTSTDENNYKAYTFSGTAFSESNTSNKSYIYPVITINSYAFFKNGDGTSENPYLVK